MKQEKITLPGSQEVYQPGCELYFSCNLKRLRLFRFPRLSQARLAGKLGITRNTYAGYESGKRLPPAWFVCCVAEYFGIPVDELVGREFTKERIKTYENLSPDHTKTNRE